MHKFIERKCRKKFVEQVKLNYISINLDVKIFIYFRSDFRPGFTKINFSFGD